MNTQTKQISQEVALELLEACKGLQWLAILNAPNGIDQEAWETSFAQLEQAINKAEGKG